MIFIEVPRSLIQGEIAKLDEAAPRAAGLEDFIKGAIYALEWIATGHNPPSELFPPPGEPVQ